MLCTKRSSKDSRPLPPLRKCGECQEENKDEETVKMNKSKAEPVSSWVSVMPGGIDQVAPASSSELDLPRVWGVPGEGGSAGRPCKRGPSRSPGRPSRDEEGDDDLGDLVP